MKALRFFFLSLLAAFSFAASAQTIEVYKDGRVIDSFSAAQVDSVVYAPAAAQPRYYYYAGWDCPTSVEDLERFVLSEDNGTKFLAGEADMEREIIANFEGNSIRNRGTDGKRKVGEIFFVIPNGCKIQSALGEVTNDLFDPAGTVGDHKIYKFYEEDYVIPEYYITTK